MFKIKKKLALGILGLAGVFISSAVKAVVIPQEIVWGDGINRNKLALTCYFTIPDQRPLTVPNTFVLDATTPVGTRVHSWNWGEFLGDMSMACVNSGISNDQPSIMGTAPELSFWVPVGAGGDYLKTSNSGLGLYLFARFNNACDNLLKNTYRTKGGGYNTCPPASSEIALTSRGDFLGTSISGPLGSIVRKQIDGSYIVNDFNSSISTRAELVVIGIINPTAGHLEVTDTVKAVGAHQGVNDLLVGKGINLVSPACQLKTKNYTIPMGRWVADTSKWLGSPAFGPAVPVNLSLECSGKVDHVRFRFEDAGLSPSGNKNISLYDTAGGNKISGLEIELLYNGTKVNVDNATINDTGSHGVTKPYPAAQPLYDSVSNAAFQARFVQNGNITRGGTNYVGPVTGKINMYITYD